MARKKSSAAAPGTPKPDIAALKSKYMNASTVLEANRKELEDQIVKQLADYQKTKDEAEQALIAGVESLGVTGAVKIEIGDKQFSIGRDGDKKVLRAARAATQV